MPRENIRDEILNALKELGSDNFHEFRDKLTDPEVTPCIKGCEVENKTRGQIMKLLISRCEEMGAVVRTVRTLRGIGCNYEARVLESKCKPRTEAENPPCVSEPSCAPKPFSDQVNKDLKGLQKVKKATTKAKKSPKNGKTLLLFGKHEGRSFKWLRQNDMQYVGYLVGTHQIDRESGDKTQTERMKNKDALADYVSHFSDAVDAVHFHREGLAPVGFGKYINKTRQELYNSKDEEEKRYVDWLRSMEKIGKGQMEALIKYILYRDKKAAVSTSSMAGPQRRSSTRRAPPQPSSQPAAKKQRL